MSDFESSLDKDLPQAWRPDQGGDDNPNPLLGKFVGMTTAQTSFGGCYVMTLELEDGSERAVWLIHTVLRNEMARARPRPGETVGIKYQGKVEVDGGQDYIAYRVRVDRPLEAFDWSKLGAGPEVEDDLIPDAPAPEAVSVPAGAGNDDDLPF